MRYPASNYAFALVALVAAILLRWWLDPLLGDSLALVTLFGAVAAAVWVGGYRPALIVAVLGYLVCAYLFIAPRGSIGLDDFSNVVGVVAYVFTCGLIIGIGEAMRRARRRASERSEVLKVTLASIGDGVITTDTSGRVTYINPVAASLTGWGREEALGQPLDDVFRIVGEENRRALESPATRALREGVAVGLANHTILLGRDGIERSIDDSAAPIRDDLGKVSGCVLIFRDISDRRHSELDAAARMMDTRLLASIVESSDDAIISKSLDGIIRSWNAAAQRLFGHTAEQAVGRHISLIIPFERMDEEERIIASLKAGRRVEHFETVRVRSDGSVILVSLTISPLTDGSGTVVGASKIVRDITQRRRAEERERSLLAETVAANAKFRAIFDQGALFAGIVDLDGTMIEPNRLWWEGCGYTREQVVGKLFWEGPWWAPSPPLVERVKAGYAEAAAGRTFREELPYYVANGSARVADVIILPIKDDAGRVLFLAPTGTDVTERKRAEAELQKFAMLVENSTDFIGICDLRGVPFYVNPAGIRIVGLASLEQARSTHVRDFFFPEDMPTINEFLATVTENGDGAIDVRFRHFGTGEAIWMSYKVWTLADEGGQTVGFATVSQDVSERKRLDDNLRKMASDLSEVDRHKDEFLATLSHELRNPLTPLRNTVEILKRGATVMPLPQAVDIMERQLGQLERLVDDLLDLNRINHNRMDLHKGEVDLASIIHQAVEATRPLAAGSRQNLRVDVPPEPIYVLGDATRLTQVIGNLLNNSCKYTTTGGTIALSAERREDEAVISVRDTGIGIPSDKLESIFEMFTRVERSPGRSGGGLGIGLALVKRLVEMHGGTVEARSAGEGQGSEFVVRLPGVIGQRRATGGPPTVLGAASRPRRVLIVDDNRDAASSLATLLRISGHETWTAYDGVGALEAAEEHRPEVLLLDIGLPRMSGHEVARRVRREDWGRDMVLIALTGWGQEGDRLKSRDAGFDHHMVKPIDYSALLSLLGAPERDTSDSDH